MTHRAMDSTNQSAEDAERSRQQEGDSASKEQQRAQQAEQQTEPATLNEGLAISALTRPNIETNPELSAVLQEISFNLGQEVQSATRLMNGLSNEVYKIELQGGQTFCLRKPRTKDAATIARRGTKVLKFLKDMQPSLQVPAVISEADDRYTVFEYFKGGPLAQNPILPLVRRQLFIKGLAAFLFSLWTVPVPAESVPAPSYYDWLHTQIDQALRRSLESDRWGDPIHFVHRRMIAARYVPVHDDATAAVKHGDLNAWNVLVNEAGLSGVVDWDTAHVVPLAATVHHPLFIADIPGWNNDNVPSDMTFEEDREILEYEVGLLAAASTIPSAMRIPKLLSTSFERQFLELSLRNRRINDKFIEVRLLHRHMACDVALEELDRFLDCHRDLQEHKIVSQLRIKLSG